MTEKLIKRQTEVSGLTTIDCKEPTWRSTTLLCNKAIGITNAKTYVFAGPVETWKNNEILMVFGRSLSQRSESNRWRADGVRVENITRIHYIGHSRGDSKIYAELQCEVEHFKGRIIFMSMYNDIVW